MRLSKRSLALAITSAATVGVITGTAGPASASTPCTAPHLCAYVDASYGGSMFPFASSDGNWSNDSQGEGFINDEASSIKNTLSVTAGVWQDASWGGPFIWCGSPGAVVSSLGSKTDEASSNWHGDCNSH